MVFSCAESNLRSPNAASLLPNGLPMFMLELSTFRGGATRLMRCYLSDSDDEEEDKGTKSPASFSETERKDASFNASSGNDKRKRKRRRKRKEKMADFSFRLAKEEIDEDFFGVTGARAPRRPKRRPKAVQCKIESLFPGSLLPKTLAPDHYVVPN